MATAKKTISLKVLFVENHKMDGTPYIVMKTILKDGRWIQIKFGDEVNTKIWKNTNQVITALIDDVTPPKTFEPYEDKDGKKKYPYVWVERIVDCKPLVSHIKRVATQDMFEVDEEDTEPVDVSGVELPFDNE